MTAAAESQTAQTHTAGPWFNDNGIIRAAADGCHLADTWDSEASSDEDEANAALLAAAPDMLAALQEARRYVERASLGASTVPAHVMKRAAAEQVVTAIDAAIAKATA